MSIYNRLDSDSPKRVRIEVLSHDRIGLVSEICSVLSSTGADIRSHRARVYSDRKGAVWSAFTAEIVPAGSIDELLHKLARIKSAVDVTASQE